MTNIVTVTNADGSVTITTTTATSYGFTIWIPLLVIIGIVVLAWIIWVVAKSD